MRTSIFVNVLSTSKHSGYSGFSIWKIHLEKKPNEIKRIDNVEQSLSDWKAMTMLIININHRYLTSFLSYKMLKILNPIKDRTIALIKKKRKKTNHAHLLCKIRFLSRVIVELIKKFFSPVVVAKSRYRDLISFSPSVENLYEESGRDGNWSVPCAEKKKL